MRLKLATALGLALSIVISAQTLAAEKPLWVAVSTPSLAGGLGKLVEKRKNDGFEAVVITQPIETALKKLQRRPDFILIVGDYEQGKERQPWCIPPKAVEMYRWQNTQSRQFPSDMAWGDFDSDQIPDVPVGRIPARSADDVALVVSKILAYENRPPTAKDLRLPIWAGTPGYNRQLDGMVTTAIVDNLRRSAPDWVVPHIIVGNGASPFCGWPPDQPLSFSSAMKDGCLIAAMIGHGDRRQFYSMQSGRQTITYSPADAAETLAKGDPTGPLVIFACLTGDFAGVGACLAEELIGLEAGPVAVIAATTESHPFTNYLSSTCLLAKLDNAGRRLGDVWLASQRAALDANDPVAEGLLRDVAGKLEAEINVSKLKSAQMLMYAIIGDPATPLKAPQALETDVATTPKGSHWKATRPGDGIVLEVGWRGPLQPVAETEARPQMEESRARFRAANDALLFAPLGSDSADSWEGDVTREGTLRLVAVGEGTFKAAAFKIAAPAAGKAGAARGGKTRK